MDLLFSSVERVFDLLRRRVPWLALLVATIGWVAAMVAFGWGTRWASSYGPGSPSVAWSSVAFLVCSPLVLLLNVGLRGIAGVPPVAWPLGFASVALAGAWVVVAAAGSPDNGGYGWLFSLWGFLYAQLFVVVVATLDELARRRRHGPGRYGSPNDERRTRRRLLQVKVLIAAGSLVTVLVGLRADGRLAGIEAAGDLQLGSADIRVAGLAVALLVLLMLALFVRHRWTARVAALATAITVALTLFALPARQRSDTALQYGWLVVTLLYLLLKAANRTYWPAWPRPAYAAPAPTGNYAAEVGWIAVSVLAVVVLCCGDGLFRPDQG
ncbi:hypothetical protein ACFOOK_30725 [Micromonospora krabiensis]|uniref:Uncharacterized protein n=1 Tax=Micromonospora krabiensis TaxID=307121 RepID=A0A1C3N340_9ACTN|nr:hypothetical protein [Micromonospora krabiensis]SBV27003.1 hypothetical protein GA0070620_2501 [Micromonospora krabiensis]